MSPDNRRRRRRVARRSNGGGTLLLVLLLGALLFLVLAQDGQLGNVTLPQVRLPEGMPRFEIPQTGIRFPVTLAPGEFKLPEIRFGGTLAPQLQDTPVPGVTTVPAGLADFGVRSKTSGCQPRGSLPDPDCTPGAVTTTLSEQVCLPGFASDPANLPESRIDAVYAAYGITTRSPGAYRVDHLVPLVLGGSNEDANLWPQPASAAPGFAEKDELARSLHAEVCGGRLSLAEAQRRFAHDWAESYNDFR